MNISTLFNKVWHKVIDPLKYKIKKHRKLSAAKRIMENYDSSKHYVFIEFYNACRIGNQMFFVSFGETLRSKYGWEIKYWTRTNNFIDHVDSFIYDRFDLHISNNIQYDLHLEEEWDWKSSPKLVHDALKQGNVLISGSFEDLSLHDSNLYRQIFTCTIKIKEKIEQYYGDLRDCVSVHVRRGDFVYLGVALDAEYYKKAIEILRIQLEKSGRNVQKFLILSDDPQWCRDNIIGISDCEVVYADLHKRDKDSMLLDLYIPTFCELGNIISCSSFTFWSAALNNNIDAICVEPYPWWNGRSELYFPNSIKLNSMTGEPVN